MSEVTSYACFYGNQTDLKELSSFIGENYSCASYDFRDGKLFVNGLGYLRDSDKAYCALAKTFPQTAFVAYEFYCNIGEFSFMYSAKDSDIYEELCPYSNDDDDDYLKEFLEELKEDEEESDVPDSPWYERIRDAVGAEGLRDLFNFCYFDGAWVFKDVPGFEDEDWDSILDD